MDNDNKSMSFAKNVVRYGASNILLNIINLLVGLILTPFIVYNLGDTQNGYWVIAKIVFGYYGFLDFGISLSVARFLSVAIGEKNTLQASKIVQSGFSFIILMDIILAAVCVLIVANIGKLNFAEDMLLVRDLLVIIGFSMFAILPGRVFSGILTAYVRQDIVVWIGILNAIIRAILIYLSLSFGYGIRALAIISGIITLITSIIYYIYAKKLMPGLKLKIFSFDFTILSSLLKYGISISLAYISAIFRWAAPPIIAGSLIGAAFVTHINIALSLGRYGMAVIAGSFVILVPVFGQLTGTGEKKKIKDIFYRSLNLTMMISVFMFGGMILLGNDFIINWMGNEYKDAYPALVLISCGLLVAMMLNPVINLMQGIGLAKTFAITNIIEAVLNILLCILLHTYGMMGFGVAFAVPLITVTLFIQPYLMIKHTNWGLKFFYIYITKYFLLSLLGLIISGIILNIIKVSGGWGAFIINSSIYSLLFMPFLIFVVMKKDDRSYIWQKITHILHH